MQYFKPAAGILVLIFVLFVLYNIIDSHLEDNRRQTQLQEARNAEAARQSGYDRCIEQAKFDKEGSESMGRSELGIHYSNGNYESALNNCIANNPLTTLQSYGSQGTKEQIVKNACNTQVTESILRSVNATPEQIEMQYQQDMRSCNTKYDQ